MPAALGQWTSGYPPVLAPNAAVASSESTQPNPAGPRGAADRRVPGPTPDPPDGGRLADAGTDEDRRVLPSRRTAARRP
jgi:hypothetical protein